MKKICILLFCFLLLGCTPKQKEIQKISYTSFDAGFDTVFYLTFYSSESEEKLSSLFQQCVSEAYGYHQLFDIYNDYEGVNNIKTINDNAGIQPVEVKPELIEMLTIAKEMNTMSKGEFDVTFGSVLKIWHNYRDAAEETGVGPAPDYSELAKASKLAGWEHVIIDETNQTVYIDQQGISLDVGGIAKGFTVEKIAASLLSKGIDTAIVNFGGNNRVIGTKPDGSNWGLGIEQPGTSTAMIAVSLPGPVSAVTSGDYHRYYVSEDGHIYHHIIDPTTLFPSELYHSVTIYTKDSGYADALSTSLFTMSVEDGKALLETFNQLHPESPASAVWIMDEGKQFDTEYSFKKAGYFITYTEDLQGKITY